MRISILTPDLSDNSLGRTHLLAKILQRRYEVEIVGPIFGDGIWEPLAEDESVTYKSIRIHGRLRPYLQIRELARQIEGDVIYASKPYFTSFGIGLFQKIFRNKPLILDIDDWEMGFVKYQLRHWSSMCRLKYLVGSAFKPYHLYSVYYYWNPYICEKLTHMADDITVSNRFLQKRFGGQIVWHARDVRAFDAERYSKDLIRERYKIPRGKRVAMFLGTPHPHKGIEDLIEAITLIQDDNILLIVVGIGNGEYPQEVARAGRAALHENFWHFGLQPFEKAPEFLAMADVIVIPQRRTVATIGQLPAKIFDAMAMGKPIIATNVSDLSEILEECGWIVEPDNPRQLAEILQAVLSNAEGSQLMGRKARQKCIEQYSWEAMENTLTNIFRKYE